MPTSFVLNPCASGNTLWDYHKNQISMNVNSLPGCLARMLVYIVYIATILPISLEFYSHKLKKNQLLVAYQASLV